MMKREAGSHSQGGAMVVPDAVLWGFLFIVKSKTSLKQSTLLVKLSPIKIHTLCRKILIRIFFFLFQTVWSVT